MIFFHFLVTVLMILLNGASKFIFCLFSFIFFFVCLGSKSICTLLLSVNWAYYLLIWHSGYLNSTKVSISCICCKSPYDIRWNEFVGGCSPQPPNQKFYRWNFIYTYGGWRFYYLKFILGLMNGMSTNGPGRGHWKLLAREKNALSNLKIRKQVRTYWDSYEKESISSNYN